MSWKAWPMLRPRSERGDQKAKEAHEPDSYFYI